MAWVPEPHEFQPVVKECLGCKKIVDDDSLPREDQRRCSVYINPEARWRIGRCPVCTEAIIIANEPTGKKRVGQQKQKKKTRRK